MIQIYMILIFDTCGGLCNQFYDVFAGINFCLMNNIRFTFRYASLRNDNLCTWRNTKFGELFDDSFLKSYDLYVDYDSLLLNNENTFNVNGKLRAIEHLNKGENMLEQLMMIGKEYIVLKQFWAVSNMNNAVDKKMFSKLRPCKKLFDVYVDVKHRLALNEYNFLHYRYESDFVNHFRINNMMKLDDLLDVVKFKNNNVKTYVAASDVENLVSKLSDEHKKNILYKNENDLNHLNFEEKAFVDYMIGLDSLEIYGHSKSSFSHMINNAKGTHNFYQ